MQVLVLLLICTFAIPSVLAAETAVNPTRPRQCYSCEGINCQRTARLNVTTSCTDLLDICVTIFDDYTVIAKGCYLDMPENYRSKCEDHNNPECFKCFGQLCNNKGRDDFKCIQCNDNTNCDKNTTGMTPVQCPIPTAPNSYCFIRKLSGQTQRGCYVHLQDQLNCLKDNSCSLCLSNDGIACNSYEVDTSSKTSKASSTSISSFSYVTMLLGTIIYLR